MSEDQHNELLALIEELQGYVAAGYAAPTDIFNTRLDRANEILWQIVE